MIDNSRVIVNLLIQDGKLVKTRQFSNSKYVGDPINAIKIFNEKAVDELVITDMSTARNGINFGLLKKMATEAFIPITYSGGISNIEYAYNLFNIGIEKLCFTTGAITQKVLIQELTQVFGSQSIVINVNIKRNFWGKHVVYDAVRKKCTSLSASDHIKSILELNIGELILTDVDRDGEMVGLNFELLKYVEDSSIPIVLAGGMRCAEELHEACKGGASAVMGGSCFIFYGPHRAVLISYPFGGGYEIMKNKRSHG